MSADGTHVIFISEATNLIANDANGDEFDVFTRPADGRQSPLPPGEPTHTFVPRRVG